MKIGIVTQIYQPEPTGFIPAGLAEELAARGHEVRVLTGYPNYPEGRIYPGYRQRWRHRHRDGGVTIRRVPLYPSHDSSAVRRIATYVSFAATSAMAAVRYLTDVDVLYVYHPPGTVFAAPALLRLLRRVPAVLHVQDVWPDSVTESPIVPTGAIGAAMHRALDAGMRWIYRRSAFIAVIAPSMRDLLIERGADPARVRVVLNWTDESLFRPVAATDAARHAIGHRGRCAIMHAGNIGPFQDVGTAIRAAAGLDQTGQVDLVFVGSGLEEDSARALAHRLGAGNVRFLGRRPPAQMAELYAAADFQLVSLRDRPILRGTIPSKLQAALACGSPVIMSAPGDAARIVEGNRVGLASPPQDANALAERFLRAAALPAAECAEMGRRARESYLAQMSRRAGVDQLEKMLSAAAERRSAR